MVVETLPAQKCQTRFHGYHLILHYHYRLPLTYGKLQIMFKTLNYDSLPIHGFQQSCPTPNNSNPMLN